MKIKYLIDKCTKRYISFMRKNKLEKYDKKICALHKEWEELDRNELKLVREDKYAYKIFKNVCGGDFEYFVSDVLYQNVILPKLNFANYMPSGRFCAEHDYFIDKNYQEFFMKKLHPPKCVLHNINGNFYGTNFVKISKDDAMKLLLQYNKLVFKNSLETGHGKAVSLIGRNEFNSILDGKKDYMIQEVLEQHESLVYYNASSVNIIRITTLFWKGNVYVLGGILRIGPPGSFCDLTPKGGKFPLIISINENGKLGSKAIDCENWKLYDNVWGKKIHGYILKYEEMKEKVKDEHLKYPKHGIIGWDLTLDKDANIRCIEYNVRCPGVMQSQYALGAIFSQKSVDGNALLDEILSEL